MEMIYEFSGVSLKTVYVDEYTRKDFSNETEKIHLCVTNC